MKTETITSITFTNEGYITTNNLLQSINKNDIDLNLKIYTSDKPSANFFRERHDNVELFEKNDFPETLLKQSDKNFGNLMIVKFNLILEL